jgi:hypothetical protein
MSLNIVVVVVVVVVVAIIVVKPFPSLLFTLYETQISKRSDYVQNCCMHKSNTHVKKNLISSINNITQNSVLT